MERPFHYDTVSTAIEALRQQGFTTDFNLPENELMQGSSADYDIVDVYRYEGNSDPADEAVVYAIASKSGTKGIFVTAYGTDLDKLPAWFLKKIHY